MRDALGGLFADQRQDDRDVVRAEAPQRVLVGAQLAEVQAVAVDVVERAQLARVEQLAQADRPPGGTRAGARPSASGPRARPRRPPLRRRRRWSRAASPRSSACRPRSTRTASSAWVGTGVASTTASSSASLEQLLELPVPRAPGNCGAEPRARLLGADRTASAARSRRSRRSCARGWAPSSRGPTTPTPRPSGATLPWRVTSHVSHWRSSRGHGAGGVLATRLRVRRSRGADRLHAALGRVPVPVELGVLGRRRALERRERGGGSRSTSVFQPLATVSTHSVLARSVTQGTPAR